MEFHYYMLHKPYGYLCQFTGEPTDLLLGQLHNFPSDVYAIGRLDKDSEGLLLLTNDNNLKNNLLTPEKNHYKTYLVQVEGAITKTAIEALENGSISINHKGKLHQVKKAICKIVEDLCIEERIPPIRFRASIPTSWIELSITEGKNRQVRKMTAAVGFPTLRLIRIQIGEIKLNELPIGKVIKLTKEEAYKALEDN
ncbi:MAG: pseudouridine synthase [Crocinitomicaceae bacterium]|nr:pseudouridine synthase [Crocinitomicaceae bacterium]